HHHSRQQHESETPRQRLQPVWTSQFHNTKTFLIAVRSIQSSAKMSAGRREATVGKKKNERVLANPARRSNTGRIASPEPARSGAIVSSLESAGRTREGKAR